MDSERQGGGRETGVASPVLNSILMGKEKTPLNRQRGLSANFSPFHMLQYKFDEFKVIRRKYRWNGSGGFFVCQGDKMPSKSDKQKKFMAAAANNPKFAKKAGIPQKVAKEYHKKDTMKKKK